MPDHKVSDVAISGHVAQSFLRLCGQANLTQAQALLAFSIALTSWKHFVQGNDMSAMSSEQIADDTTAVSEALMRIVTGASAH